MKDAPHELRSHLRSGVAGLAVALLLSACTALDPVVTIEPAAINGDAYVDAMALPRAVAYGEEVRIQYRRRISDQILLENTVGVGLISAAAASFGLAALGEAPEIILGLGSAGGAAYVGGKAFASKLQQTIYAAGAGAISCSIAAMAPRRAAYANLGELKELIEGAPKTALESLRADLDEQQALLDKNTTPELRGTVLFKETEAVLAVGRDAERRGKDGIIALENAGAELMGAITAIEEQVDREIIAARPDLSALVASLSQIIPTAAGQITGQVAKPAVAAASSPGKAAFNDEARVGQLNKDITNKARRINLLADRVGDRPPVAALATCKVDVEAAGLTFALDHAGEIAVDASSANQVITINASGGTPPYSSEWSGVTPNDKITQKVEDRYSGRVVVKVATDATSGKFTLLVKDAAKGSSTVTFNVTGGAGQTTQPVAAIVAPAAANNPSTITPDPAIQKIQQALTSDPFNMKSVKIDGIDKVIKVDGIWGKITQAAITSFLTGKVEPLPTDKSALVASAQKQLGLTN